MNSLQTVWKVSFVRQQTLDLAVFNYVWPFSEMNSDKKSKLCNTDWYIPQNFKKDWTCITKLKGKTFIFFKIPYCDHCDYFDQCDKCDSNWPQFTPGPYTVIQFEYQGF